VSFVSATVGMSKRLSISSLTHPSRLNLESTKREQRLLLEPRHRAMSLGGQWYTSGALATSSQHAPLALPAPEDEHPLYKDWEIFNRWLKSEDQRVTHELDVVRPSSWGDTPAPIPSGDRDAASALYHLRREVEDAILLEENRSKRMASKKRSHLAPTDAMEQKVRNMPPAPTRTYTLQTEHSGNFSQFESHPESHNFMENSVSTLRPNHNTPSPRTSPVGSPQIEREYFGSGAWVPSPASSAMSPELGRSSVSTTRTSLSMSPDTRLSVSFGLGISTAGTTPDDALVNNLHPVLSATSMATIALGEGALQWSSLCRKVHVERKSSKVDNGKERFVTESQVCDIHWRYREDFGISIRALYRSKTDGKAKVWTVQDFLATGPSIPLTTTIDKEISVSFPRGSFGKLDKHWVDITYTFTTFEASAAFQTLLYSNNGKDAAELLFDRPIRTISSDKHRPECRGRNLRLWRRTEMRLEPSGLVGVVVLMLLFYTSCLEGKGHWVEEPHYAFEWLSEPTYKKESDKLTLEFSKDAAKWTTDKLFPGRKSSQSSAHSEVPTSPITAKRKDSMGIPGITRSGTHEAAMPVASTAASIRSSRSIFGKRDQSSTAGGTNRFGYSKLDIEFMNSKDRRAFLDVWRTYVNSLGVRA
jgi:hypothetical protein